MFNWMFMRFSWNDHGLLSCVFCRLSMVINGD